jgi:hypothetical protein
MTIYAKTKKGMDEMLSSKTNIDKALGSVLILVDGQRSDVDLSSMILRLKAPADSLAMLLHGGFIEPSVVTAPVVHTLTAEELSRAKAKAQQVQAQKDATQDENTSTFLTTYSYMVGEAKKHLGLRGFGLQLKLERAQTPDELRSLIAPMSESIAKSQGLQAGNDFKKLCTDMLDVKQLRDASQRLVDEAQRVQARRSQLRRVA